MSVTSCVLENTECYVFVTYTVKMGAVTSSETLVATYETTL
jgi:hypothetical protein